MEFRKGENSKHLAERRKFPRLNAVVNVEYSIIGEGPLKYTESTKNIGAGGICLIVYEEIKINTLLSLKFFLPDSNEPIQAKGRVVWKGEFSISSDQIRRYDLGIEFVEIGEEDRERISKYVFTRSYQK